MRKLLNHLLFKVIVAIILGVLLSKIIPIPLAKVFITFNSVFGNFLSFVIPLIILGLVAPGIADIGKGAGKLLALTVGIAYVSTIASGLFSYITCSAFVPNMVTSLKTQDLAVFSNSNGIKEFFTIEMPPVMTVTSSLVLAFILGLGSSAIKGEVLKNIFSEFREIVFLIINKIIVPLLPLFIFGIFLKIGIDGQAGVIIKTFMRIIVLIFIMHIILLLSQFIIAGIISKRNPLKALIKMLPAYFTALGTQSSAATIPVTLASTKKNGINDDIADFVIPLCATIHLSGSMLKIVATAFTVMYIGNVDHSLAIFGGFIMMLAITMVAAPGVPGGAIMAAIAILQQMLGFNQDQIGLMVALYIAMDSFGTAANVTGDGAIAMIVNKIYGKAE